MAVNPCLCCTCSSLLLFIKQVDVSGERVRPRSLVQGRQCHTLLSWPWEKPRPWILAGHNPSKSVFCMMADTNPQAVLWDHRRDIQSHPGTPATVPLSSPSVQPGFGHLDPGLPPPTAKNLLLISHLNLAQGSPASIIHYILLKHLT